MACSRPSPTSRFVDPQVLLLLTTMAPGELQPVVFRYPSRCRAVHFVNAKTAIMPVFVQLMDCCCPRQLQLSDPCAGTGVPNTGAALGSMSYNPYHPAKQPAPVHAAPPMHAHHVHGAAPGHQHLHHQHHPHSHYGALHVSRHYPHHPPKDPIG